MFWDKFLKSGKKSKDSDAENSHEDSIGLSEDLNMEESEGFVGDELSSLLGEDDPKAEKKSSNSFAIMPDDKQDIFTEDIEDDDVIMEDIPEGKLAELQNMFKMFDSEDVPLKDTKRNQMLNEDAAEADESLDSAIQKALEQDMNESRNMDSLDGNMEFLSDVTVYDTVDGPATKEKKLKEKTEKESIITKIKSMVDNMTPKKMYITMGSLIGLIVVFGIIGAVLALNANKIDGSVTRNGILITQPVYGVNNANFIFTEIENTLNNEPYKIQKILIDREATVFYFDNELDARSLVITMKDDNEKIYYLDLNDLKPLQEEVKRTTKSLRLEPLDEGVKHFVLSLLDPSTNDSAEYEFSMRNHIVYPPAKYLSGKIDVLNDGTEPALLLEKAKFTSAGSSIHYRLENQNGSKTLMMNKEDGKQSIVLNEGIVSISPKINLQNEYEMQKDNVILGRMDYEGLNSLQSNINIIFKNLYEVHSFYEEVAVSPLFNDREEDQIVLEMSHYNIILERMKQYQDKMVMVFHTEDKNVPLQKVQEAQVEETDENEEIAVDNNRIVTEDNYDNRVETQIDVKLLMTTGDGQVFTIDGVNRSVKEGTDVLFEFKENAAALSRASTQGLTIKIDQVHIKLNDITVPIELASTSRQLEPADKNMDAFIKDTFCSRLAYKSGQTAESEMTGFSTEVLSDKKLMNYYTPEQITEPKYTAQLITGTISDGKMEGIVKEIWYGTGEQPIFCLTHAVEAVGNEESWQIVEDIILES